MNIDQEKKRWRKIAEDKLRDDLELAVVKLMMYGKYTENRMCRLVRIYYRSGLRKQEEDEEFIQTLMEEYKNGN